MKWPWISRRAGAEQLAREIQRGARQLAEVRAAIENTTNARLLAITQERDWLRERNEQLVDTIIAFKRDGFGIPSKGSIKQPVDVEAQALARAEGQLTKRFLENATSDIIAQTGVSAHVAEAEARRLREEAVSEHPAGG